MFWIVGKVLQFLIATNMNTQIDNLYKMCKQFFETLYSNCDMQDASYML